MSTKIDNCANLVSKLIDTANAVILYLDAKGRVRLCNGKIEQLSGMKRDDIIGRRGLDILYPENGSNTRQQLFDAFIASALEHKQPNSFIGNIPDRSGDERTFCWNITPILSDTAQVEGVLLLGNDLTEIDGRATSVRNKDDMLRNIISSIKDYALFATNVEGKITYYAMGSTSLFGWGREEIIFRDSSVFYKTQEASSKLAFALEEVRRKGECEIEIEMVKKDGEALPVLLSINKLADTEGKLRGYIFIAKDITERKNMEYHLVQSEKLIAMGQLTAGLAHEINNPLFVISGRLDLLLEQKGIGKNQRQELGIIREQTDRIRVLVDRFLRFSRKSSSLKPDEIDINKLIENVLPLLSYHELHTKDITIRKGFAEGLPKVRVDINQLQEVFINLFLNAFQAMPDGGTLDIKTRNLDGNSVEIRISDSGYGISPENIKKIFTPFFTTKNEGTGLGLPICYNIIRNHNGTIDLKSEVGKGTTFIIKLPF